MWVDLNHGLIKFIINMTKSKDLNDRAITHNGGNSLDASLKAVRSAVLSPFERLIGIYNHLKVDALVKLNGDGEQMTRVRKGKKSIGPLN